MKINVEVDVTPGEARAFLGLPDVAPVQEEVLNEMKKKVLSRMEEFDATLLDPSKMMENYFSLYPKWMETFSRLGKNMPGT